jgi:hypothetical protein
MKIDKTAIEEIAEMEAKIAEKRAQLFADVLAFVEEHSIDKKALCAALRPKRPRAAKVAHSEARKSNLSPKRPSAAKDPASAPDEAK